MSSIPSQSKSKLPIILAVCLITSAGLLLPSAAHGIFGEIVNGLFNGVLNLALRLLSGLFSLLVAAFIALVSFDFTRFWGVGESVDTAWRLLRDLANMLIIIGMLYIAFSTILKVGSAKWKNLAGGLLIMAVAVNFSKTIALIILDAGQMLMMTFVRAFQDIAVDNLTSGLMITKIYNQGNNFNWGLNVLTTWATQWLMIFMMIITVLVMLVIVILLIIRIVMIWFFVAVSPIAFAGYALPALKQHASKWWSFYVKLVFFGPMLAFFLWFSFLFMSRGIVPDTQFDAINQSVGMNYTDQQYFASEATSAGNVIKFLLAVILLIVGTGMAIKAADFGGNVAGKVWGGAGGWSDRWRAKGGKLRDLPGAKALGNIAQKTGLTKRIDNLRARIAPEGKEVGAIRTLFGKGKSGIIRGEYGGIAGKLPQFMKDFASRAIPILSNVLPSAMRLSSPYVREEIGEMRKEKHRTEIATALNDAELIMYMASRPEEALQMLADYATDSTGRYTNNLREQDELQKKLNSPQKLQDEAKGYYKQLTSEIDQNEMAINTQIIDSLIKKDIGQADWDKLSKKDKEAEIEKVKGNLQRQSELDIEADITKLNSKQAELKKEKENIFGTDQLDETTTDEVWQEAGKKIVANQLTDVRQSQLAMAGIGKGVGFDMSGVTSRLDRVNKSLKKEQELLTAIASAKDQKIKDQLTGDLNKLYTALDKEFVKGTVQHDRYEALKKASKTALCTGLEEDIAESAGTSQNLKELLRDGQEKLKGYEENKSGKNQKDIDAIAEKQIKYAQEQGAVGDLDSVIGNRLDNVKDLLKKENKLLEQLKTAKEKGQDVLVKNLNDQLSRNESELKDNIASGTPQEALLKKLADSQNKGVYDRIDALGALTSQVEADDKQFNSLKQNKQHLSDMQEAADADISQRDEWRRQKEEVDRKVKADAGNATASRIKREFYRKTRETSLVNKEKEKIRTLDWPTLIGYYEHAKADRNVNLAKAIFEKLIEDANINEICQSEVGDESPDGFRRLGRKFMKDFGLNEQDAFGFMKEISDASENIGHWTYAYTHIFDHGKYRETTEKEQAKLCLPMMEKRGVSNMLDTTRLSVGYTDKNGNPALTTQGMAWLLGHKDQLAWNVNRNMARPEFVRHIVNFGKLPKGGSLKLELDGINTSMVSNHPLEQTLWRMFTNKGGILTFDPILVKAMQALGGLKTKVEV